MSVTWEWYDDKYCPQCESWVVYDKTEHEVGCLCSLALTVPDENGLPSVEYIPDFWIDKVQIAAPRGESE